MQSQEYTYELKIPKERVAVLIGVKGVVKRQIESATKTRLEINSKEGDVSITGKDALKLYIAKEIVQAIGRGFAPEIATLLMKQDYGFEIVSMTPFARNQNDYLRLRGRVIGKEGKSRKTIEDLTNSYVSVYGKTVSIIGNMEELVFARRAVESLLRGSLHGNVYRAIEKEKKKHRLVT